MFCTYHSILDWHHPDYPLGSPGGRTAKPSPDMDRYIAFLKGQVAELIRNYGPLGIMWFDGQWEKPWNPERGRDLYDWVRSLQPSIIVNNRVGATSGPTEGAAGAASFSGDYDTPEQKIGQFQTGRPWESCTTICDQWAWKLNDKLKSLEECVRTLVSCAGGNGNLLFNVGPMPDGRIEPRQAERLEEIGRWLEANSASIYGTRGGPFKPRDWGASTHKDRTVFLHVFAWPEGALTLPAIDKKIASWKVLTGGDAEVTQDRKGIRIVVPAESRRDSDTIVALELDGPASDIPPLSFSPKT